VLMARHFADAAISRMLRACWGKAGQRSAERIALVKPHTVFKRRWILIATLSSHRAPRDEIKLQVELSLRSSIFVATRRPKQEPPWAGRGFSS